LSLQFNLFHRNTDKVALSLLLLRRNRMKRRTPKFGISFIRDGPALDTRLDYSHLNNYRWTTATRTSAT